MPYLLGWGSSPTPLQHLPPPVLIWTKIFELCCDTKRNKSSQQVERHGGNLIFGLVARVVLFWERFINPVCLCGIYFCLISRRMECMKSFYLICIWFVFIDTFTAVPSRLFPPQHVAVVVFINWIPYHQQKPFFFALIPVLPLEEQAAVGGTSSNMSHLAPKRVGEEKHHFKPKFNIRINFW